MELELLTVAAQNQDWLALGLVAVAVVVPLVLKALGKKIPMVDSVAAAVVSFVKGRPKAAPPPPAKDEKTGIAAVVDLRKE